MSVTKRSANRKPELLRVNIWSYCTDFLKEKVKSLIKFQNQTLPKQDSDGYEKSTLFIS